VLKRIFAALCALALVLPVLFLGGLLGAQLLVALVLVLVLWEYAPLADQDDRVSIFAVMLMAGGGLYALATWGPDAWLAGGLIGAMFAVLTYAMLSRSTPEAGAKTGAVMVLGLLYLPLPLALICKVREFGKEEDGFAYGLSFVLLVLVCTWAADTGAYFAGRTFGKTKLLERISPKKTWAGVWGGVALAVLCAVAMVASGAPDITPMHAAAIGALVGTVGVVGDLIESMLKRASGIKDTGGIMPGHGGMLDRVDSLLFTMPAAWAYASIFGLTLG